MDRNGLNLNWLLARFKQKSYQPIANLSTTKPFRRRRHCLEHFCPKRVASYGFKYRLWAAIAVWVLIKGGKKKDNDNLQKVDG